MDPPTYPFEETSFMNGPLQKSILLNDVLLAFPAGLRHIDMKEGNPFGNCMGKMFSMVSN